MVRDWVVYVEMFGEVFPRFFSSLQAAIGYATNNSFVVSIEQDRWI